MDHWTRAAPLDPVEARLLQQIKDNPDDNGPRLVYADFLVDRGDPRGELIVLQCSGQPEHLDRATRLLQQHELDWFGPHATSGLSLERGFLKHPLAVHADDPAPRDPLFRFSPTLFEVVRPLGSEGYGKVWEGIEHGPLGDVGRVSIKIYRDEETTEAAVEAVLDEDRAGRLCRHPAIAQHKGLAHLDGALVLVREPLDGVNLQQLLDQGVFPTPVASAVGLAVGRALEHIHTRVDDQGAPLNLVHGRLSRENVIVTRDGRVKLVDVGWLRATRAGLQLFEHHLVGPLSGTPPSATDHMSPEQVMGYRTDARSDIFSVGSLLYTLVAARPPFAGGDPMAALTATVRSQPTPLDARVAAALREVVDRALQKDADQRYQSAGELAEAIETLWRNQDWPPPKEVLARAVERHAASG